MKIELSIVIPLYNESENIISLSEKIESSLKNISWECIWVNDGSSDNSLEVLNALRKKNPQHEIIDLQKNFGQSAALMVGFQNAQGKYIGTLDGDGQNDPNDLVTMVGLLNNNAYDVINGYRANRQDSFLRKFSSKIANFVRRFVTKEYEVKDIGCSARVFRRECIGHVPLFRGMHRFLPTLIKMNGYKMHQIPVNHFPREKGVTKYTLNNRLWVGIIDLFAVRWMLKRLVFPKIKSSTKIKDENIQK